MGTVLGVTYSPENFRRAVRAGTHLLETAGGAKAAMRAFRKALPDSAEPLKGIHSPTLDGVIPSKLLAYLRAMQEEGVGPRREGKPERVIAAPHPSAAEYIDEALEKIWADAAEGRILLSNSKSNALGGVRESSIARVPKMNPDRTLAEDGRFITDMKATNVKGSKHRHPPALQPRHAEVAREILWWSWRHPGVRILMCKRDVSSAFKIINVSEDCSLIMAVGLPGSAVGLEHDVTVMYRVMNFGWVGAPGEWMAWAWALKFWFEEHAPEDPDLNDTIPFHVFILMDDPVLVEPDIGLRPWLSAGT